MVDQDDFMEIDNKVMRHAFDIHNKYGYLCDEAIYKNEIAYRCGQEGLDSLREIQISVSHKTFCKKYFIDLLIDKSAIYELKTSCSINSSHCQQLLNYILLTNAKHGKVIAFGGRSVNCRFVSTKLDCSKRHKIDLVKESWTPFSEKCSKLPDLLECLLEDWGGFLSIGLYREALSSILSKGDGLGGNVNIVDGNRIIGTQRELVLSPDVVLVLTGYSKGIDSIRKQLIRLLKSCSAEAIQWINFNRHKVTLSTLTK